MLSLLLLAFITTAHATLDALSGARVSLATTQQLLAAPFLPNLSSEDGHLGVQVSYLRARLKGADNDRPYDGRFAGSSVGLSYSPPVKQDVGYYFGGVYSKTDGKASHPAEVETEGQYKFTTAGVVANGGGSLRLLGRSDANSMIGIFGGPAVMQFDSEMRIREALYTSSPFIYGVTVGVQWRFHLGNFVFNPYALRFEAFTNACTGVSTAEVSFTDHCPGDETRVALMPSFNAYGLVFGYRSLEANVFARAVNASVLRDVAVANLSLSYTF